MKPELLTFLVIWGSSAMISSGIIGASMRDAVNKADGKDIEGDGFVFLFFLSILLGPIMTALLIGFVARGNK